MIPPPPPGSAAPWTFTPAESTRTALSLLAGKPGCDPVPVLLRRCAATPLAAGYPVGARDIALDIGTWVAPATVTELLTALVPAVLRADPECRRVVVAVDGNDQEQLAAVVAAGLRPTVDIELPAGEFVLTVAEPAWVCAVDMDLDRVPGT